MIDRSLPGLDSSGCWAVPVRMNMATQCLAHDANKVAIIDLTGAARRDVSFGELTVMVDGLARALRQRVQANDRVGVLLSQSPWCAAAHLAIWKIGAISVPLFKLFKHDALASRVQDAGITLVLTDTEGRDLLGDLAQAEMADSFGIAGDPVATADTGPEDPAVLIYTSGTTGTPKGAVHGHRVLTGHLPGVSLSHDILGQDGDCLWTPADWAWIGGLFDVLMPGLALGVPVVAARLPKFSIEACVQIIRDGDVRNVFFPPTALRMLKAGACSIAGLRSVASGGEPLGAEMLAWGQTAFGLSINEFYGQTECNMVASSSGTQFPPRPGCIGKPVPGHDVAVLDADGAPAQGEGDVAIRKGSTSMMLGYWQRPEETALKYPAEIEDCLLTHPDVATCGVVGKPDPLRTEIVKAYVVLKEGATVDAETLQTWVKTRLASYSYPREVAFLDALPMTVTGKVIRRELKARAMSETSQ